MPGRSRVELGGVCWWLARGSDPEAATPMLEKALASLRGGELGNLKAGRRKQLYPLDLAGTGTADHFLKVNDYRGLASLRRALRRSKARHELEMAEQVAVLGIPTPRPVAAGERRSGGRLRACYLLMPILPGVVDLRRWWLEGKPPPRERRALLARFGALTRRIHDAGIFQDDFAPNNFLARTGASPELFMIDFERAQLRRANDDAARCFMLAKIDRELAGAPLGDRMRFLHAYSGGDRSAARAWWRRVEAFAPLLARRDFARLARNTRRDGRRFRRLACRGWSGFARRGIDEALLVEAIPEKPGAAGRARAEVVGALWRVHYTGVRRSEAGRIWTTANFLWARGGLCPRPWAAWLRDDQLVLLLEHRAKAQASNRVSATGPARAALRVLFDRILALAELREPPRAEFLCLEPQANARFRATLLDTRGVHVTGAASPGRRQRVEALTRAVASQEQP